MGETHLVHLELIEIEQNVAMTNYRRFRRRGGTYFFTVNLQDRRGTLLVDHIHLLRSAYGTVQRAHPFKTEAIVILPDHLHAVWTLPCADADFSTRWKKIKREFTVALGLSMPRSRSQVAKGEAGVWQRRFWEHCVRNDGELQGFKQYIWSNPVKHGLVNACADWPYSSYHRDVCGVGGA